MINAYDAGATGYRLQAGSPCIDAGTTVTGSPVGMGTLDYFGNAVPAGTTYDIGAHEYQSGPDTQAPTAPANLTAAPVSTTQINLSWTASTDNVGVAGYKVFRGGLEIGTASGTTYQDTGLQPNTAYSYYVKAYDAAGNISAQSNTAQATTLDANPSPSPSPSSSPSPTPSASPSPGPSVSPGVNLALNKTTTTSSVQGTDVGSRAVDGSTGTRWWTLKNSTQTSEWIVVDLGGNYNISRAVINQDDRYARTFTIQVSTDNVNWTTAANTSSGIRGVTTLNFASIQARYVKMDSTLWSMGTDRVKLIEFEIYQ
jgi:chitodextrinase